MWSGRWTSPFDDETDAVVLSSRSPARSLRRRPAGEGSGSNVARASCKRATRERLAATFEEIVDRRGPHALSSHVEPAAHPVVPWQSGARGMMPRVREPSLKRPPESLLGHHHLDARLSLAQSSSPPGCEGRFRFVMGGGWLPSHPPIPIPQISRTTTKNKG